MLDLRHMNLQELPTWLGDRKHLFPALRVLRVSGNPLVDPGTELGRRALKDLSSTVFGVQRDEGKYALGYLQNMHLPSVRRRQVQVVTVGNGEVGKSSLLQSAYFDPLLKDLPQDLRQRSRTTMALLLRHQRRVAGASAAAAAQAERTAEAEGDDKYWFLFRDLPGQAQFWSSNMHFLSADCAVFLVVLSLKRAVTELERQQQLDMWLGSLDALATGNRAGSVLVVCTHADEASPAELRRAEEWLQRETSREHLQRVKGYRALGRDVPVRFLKSVVAFPSKKEQWNRCVEDMKRLRAEVSAGPSVRRSRAFAAGLAVSWKHPHLPAHVMSLTCWLIVSLLFVCVCVCVCACVCVCVQRSSNRICTKKRPRCVHVQVDRLVVQMLRSGGSADGQQQGVGSVPGFLQPARDRLQDWRRQHPSRWKMSQEEALDLVSLACPCP